MSSRDTLWIEVIPVATSWTKMSWALLVSPGTRLLAKLSKTTNLPSADTMGQLLAPLAWPPAELTLTRRTVPRRRS